MAKPYKLTPFELVLSPVEHFEDNLSKFLNDENIADDKNLLLLQDALRRVDEHRPYLERPTVTVTDPPKRETSPQDSAVQSKEKELNSIVSKIGNLLPLTYREQSKRVLSYLMLETAAEHQVRVDSTGKRIIIQGKSYNLVNLI